jgi:RHS repeat-associated protein
VDVTGASLLTNTVTVNGQTAYRNQEYYRQSLTVNNTNSALWTNITVTGGQTVTGHAYVAQQPEIFQYDPDGNLQCDGRWNYAWDAENRLIGMTVNNSTGPQYQLSFSYDPKGRRIQKSTTLSGVTTTTNFLYDGWNLIAEVGTSGSLVRAYTWGTDLSGSQQGAGGVGGLLEVSYHGASATTNAFVACDGNGNVTALINAGDGTVLADYDYGPFGEPIRLTGALGKCNPLRFSTKYQDDESDLLYYGYRYYKPSTGMWLSRDPIEEGGGENLYFFVGNYPVNLIDILGLVGCGEYIGKAGHPLYVFTEMKEGWSGVVALKDRGGSAGARAIQEIDVKWEANVTVLCNCPCGMRQGTRVTADSALGLWLVYDPKELPLGVPVITSIANGISKLIAAGIKKVMGSSGEASTPVTVKDMVKTINSFPVPTTPYGGSWEGGKSPCD